MRLETLTWTICIAGLLAGGIVLAVFLTPAIGPERDEARHAGAPAAVAAPAMPAAARTHYQDALDAFARQDWIAVVDQTTAAIRLHAAYADAYFTRAQARRALGRHQSALRDFDRAIGYAPHNPDYRSAKARLYFDRGDFADCEATAADALSLAADRSDDWDLRGNCVAALERYEEALELYERAIDADKANVRARANRALTLVEMGRIRQGVRGARQVVATRTTDLYALTKCLDIFIRLDLKRDMTRTIDLIRRGNRAAAE